MGNGEAFGSVKRCIKAKLEKVREEQRNIVERKVGQITEDKKSSNQQMSRGKVKGPLTCHFL